MGFVTKDEVGRRLSDYKRAPSMARAQTHSDWLPQFKVFNEIRLQEDAAAEEESAWARRLPPSGRHGAWADGETRQCKDRRVLAAPLSPAGPSTGANAKPAPRRGAWRRSL